MYGTSEITFFISVRIWQIKKEYEKKNHIENSHLAYNLWNVYFTDIVKLVHVVLTFPFFLCFCTEGEILNATVEASKLDYHIKDLKALTDYRISVEVMYFSFTTLRSEYLEVTTNRNYSLIHTEDFKGNIVFRCWKMFCNTCIASMLDFCVSNIIYIIILITCTSSAVFLSPEFFHFTIFFSSLFHLYSIFGKKKPSDFDHFNHTC